MGEDEDSSRCLFRQSAPARKWDACCPLPDLSSHVFARKAPHLEASAGSACLHIHTLCSRKCQLPAGRSLCHRIGPFRPRAPSSSPCSTGPRRRSISTRLRAGLVILPNEHRAACRYPQPSCPASSSIFVCQFQTQLGGNRSARRPALAYFVVVSKNGPSQDWSARSASATLRPSIKDVRARIGPLRV